MMMGAPVQIMIVQSSVTRADLERYLGLKIGASVIVHEEWHRWPDEWWRASQAETLRESLPTRKSELPAPMETVKASDLIASPARKVAKLPYYRRFERKKRGN